MRLVNKMKNMIHAIEKLQNTLIMKMHKVTYGKNINIKGTIKIYGKGGSIHIGDSFFANSGIRYNPIGMCTKIILQTIDNGRIDIGNHVGISNCCIAAKEHIIIEDDVLIGGGCIIMDTDFHSIRYENRMKRPEENIKCAPVHIKKGAFIGTQSIILKGVTIGEKAVIGAGSVVIKDVPAGEIWAGNPAVRIKSMEKCEVTR